jgi:hypothetical protein
VISKNPGTIISFGSEIRPIEHLDQLLQHHLNYEHLRRNITHGVNYPIRELDEKTRHNEVQKQLSKGNHKSALIPEGRKHVDKLMHEDIKLGYGIPITTDCAAKLKHAEVYPVGLQHQTTIDARGASIPKKRVTHDLSNNRTEGKSINQRVIEPLVPKVIFGYTLLRICHAIHHIRYHNPSSRILLNKVDIEKAYRRVHTSAKMASKCIAVWFTDNDATVPSPTNTNEIAVIMSRLPFGSLPAPAEFSQLSDVIFDLANDLIECDEWDPIKHPAPLASHIPTTKRLKNLTFTKALEPDVKLPNNMKSTCDGYIDDGIAIVLDNKDTTKMVVERTRQAMVMALHTIFRPNAGDDEPIPRPEAASMRKLAADGGLAEEGTVLGWLINTRSLKISLPDDKAVGWIQQIREVRRQKHIKWKPISQLVGRLDHVCYIIPAARHFMNRLRRISAKAEKYKTAIVTNEAKQDLALWEKLILRAQRGISINNVIFRVPTSINLSDSCERGIAGIHSSQASLGIRTHRNGTSFIHTQPERIPGRRSKQHDAATAGLVPTSLLPQHHRQFKHIILDAQIKS